MEIHFLAKYILVIGTYVNYAPILFFEINTLIHYLYF